MKRKLSAESDQPYEDFVKLKLKAADNKIKKIKFIRIGWDQLGNKGLLKRIYTDYPAYKMMFQE